MATWSNEAKSAANAAKCALCDGGFLRLYDAGFVTLLVEIVLPSPAFQPDVNGTAVSEPIPGGLALADGTLAACRIYEADGVTTVVSGTVGLIGDPDPFDVRTSSLSATTGQSVTVNPITFIQG